MKTRISDQMKIRIDSLILLLLFTVFCTAQEIKDPLGVIVNHIKKETGRYIGSPGLWVLPDGTYPASHDEFGPRLSELRSAQTFIFQSKDKGMTWSSLHLLTPIFWMLATG